MHVHACGRRLHQPNHINYICVVFIAFLWLFAQYQKQSMIIRKSWLHILEGKDEATYGSIVLCGRRDETTKENDDRCREGYFGKSVDEVLWDVVVQTTVDVLWTISIELFLIYNYNAWKLNWPQGSSSYSVGFSINFMWKFHWCHVI